MDKKRFTLILPMENVCGNLFWRLPKNAEEAQELHALFEAICYTGMWCSTFQEGDGFCFTPTGNGKLDPALLTPEYYRSAIKQFKEIFGEDLAVETYQFKSCNGME
ncbi:MAG TPA: hypothetical protein VK588_01745 [Chitinophagaceae bacterium]|nr:hypothetical protein [Chitinophagaceae bacterium]